MKINFKHNFGFTLLELLVVISIIGILLAVGTVAFSSAQQKGRDSRRKADIQALQKAFEQYYSQNGSYAADCSTMAQNYISGGYSAVVDPKTGANYSCSANADSYCVCAELDDNNGGNASNANCTWADGGSYFCAQNLQ